MWVKASGTRLADLTAEVGHVAVDLPRALEILEDRSLAELEPGPAQREAAGRLGATVRRDPAEHDSPAGGIGATGGGAAVGGGRIVARPSMETLFHAVLGRLVVHTHPVMVNAFTCMRGGRELLEERLPEPIVWVPYQPPGLGVSSAIADSVRGFRRRHGRLPELVFLENHGLIASGASPGDCLQATERAVAAGKACFGSLDRRELEAGPEIPDLVEWARAVGLEVAARQRTAGRDSAGDTVGRPAVPLPLQDAGRTGGPAPDGAPLVPDDVVYCGARFWRASAGVGPREWVDALPEPTPRRMLIALEGRGLVLVGPGEGALRAMEETLLAHILVRRLIARRGEARPLGRELVATLVSMESEAYRQSVVAAP